MMILHAMHEYAIMGIELLTTFRVILNEFDNLILISKN